MFRIAATGFARFERPAHLVIGIHHAARDTSGNDGRPRAQAVYVTAIFTDHPGIVVGQHARATGGQDRLVAEELPHLVGVQRRGRRDEG